jgi:hypothetical protein
MWVAVLVGGCARSDGERPVYPVQGAVWYEGHPLANATVVFHPRDPECGERPLGKTDANGAFALSTRGSNDGAPEGEYAVTVIYCPVVAIPGDEPVPGPNVLPAHYATPTATRLSARIVPGPNTLERFELRLR